MPGKPLGELLLEAGVITPEQLRIALNEQARTGRLLGEILEALNFAQPAQILEALSIQGGIPYVALHHTLVDVALVDRFSLDSLKEHHYLPLWEEEREIAVAMVDPGSWVVPTEVQRIVPKEVRTYAMDGSEFQALLKELYPSEERGFAPRRTIYRLLTRALDQGVREIHLDPVRATWQVRFLGQGLPTTVDSIPGSVVEQYMTLLERMFQWRGPPEGPRRGLTQFFYRNREYDVRSVALRTVGGWKVRLLPVPRERVIPELPELGFLEEHLEAVEGVLQQRSPGLILLIGPPVEGRTLLGYSLFLRLLQPRGAVATLERTPLHTLGNVVQFVAGEEEERFSEVLSEVAQSHWDLLFVDEVRKREDFQQIIELVLNGSIVVCGFTARDVADGLVQIIAMGTDPYWLGRVLRLAIAHRVVRMICENCKVSYELSAQDAEIYGLTGGPWRLYRGQGCSACFQTGYRGETNLFELLIVDESVRRRFERKPDYRKIAEIVQEHALGSLFHDGLQKATQGITTIEEVLRVLR